MTAFEKYMARLEGIDERMRAWIRADRRRLRHASCRLWLNDFMFRSIEITQDVQHWRIYTWHQIAGDLKRFDKAVKA